MKYPKQFFNVVLIEPEIPSNTGNIGRTCVGSWSSLHLVGELGFEINDKQLRRAGLDYWPYLDFKHHASFEQWWEQVPDKERVFFFSTKVSRAYTDQEFRPGDWLVFGKETKGLEESLLQEYASQSLTIPFPGKLRSFNLSNAVAMVLGEGLRQLKSEF